MHGAERMPRLRDFRTGDERRPAVRGQRPPLAGGNSRVLGPVNDEQGTLESLNDLTGIVLVQMGLEIVERRDSDPEDLAGPRILDLEIAPPPPVGPRRVVEPFA